MILVLGPARAAWASEAAGSLTVEATPARPVLGVDQEVRLAVRIVAPSGQPAASFVGAPRLSLNAGTIEDLAPEGEGGFAARLVLPARRFPQVLILAVEAKIPDPMAPQGRRAEGWLFLPLAAVANPAFKTDPGARVTMRVGDQSFGPKSAGEDGEIRIPVVVPPGIEIGVARSENAQGLAVEEAVDLKLPPFQQTLIVAPSSMARRTATEVTVFGVTRNGTPAPVGSLRLSSASTRAQPLAAGPGWARFLVTAPVFAGGDEETPRFSLRARVAEANETSEQDNATVQIALTPPHPAKFVLKPNRPSLTLGGRATAAVLIAAHDPMGRPATNEGAAVFIDGKRAVPTSVTGDYIVVVVPSPVKYAGRDRITIEAVKDAAYGREDIMLGNLPPRTVAPPEPGPPRATLALHAGGLWTGRTGGPTFLIEGSASGTEWPRWLHGALCTGFFFSVHDASDAKGLSRTAIARVPVLAGGGIRLSPARRIEAQFAAEVGVTFWRASVRAFDSTLIGSGWAPATAASAQLAVALPADVTVAAGLRYLWSPAGRLSDGDNILGNLGGLMATAGIRWRW